VIGWIGRAGLAVCACAVALAARPAVAGYTSTLPQGAFLLDGGWVEADTEVAWGNERQPLPLLQGLDRYEPGGGLQGTITARPFVRYRMVVGQLFYGVTDSVTVAVGVPIITSARIAPNLGWTPGDYQTSLGRSYSEDDFWQWARSMGQPKPAAYDGNHGDPADIVVGARWRLPELAWLEALGARAALSTQIALPTGVDPDPEELVAAGTKVWDLHSYADAEFHLSLERQWLWDGVPRLTVGVDGFYGWMRPRTLTTSTGARHPLLLTYAAYVGPTYTLDPGDFRAVGAAIEVVPLVGPTWATLVSGHSLAKARALPPLLTLIAGHTYNSVGQSRFESASAVWSWDREKQWKPGDKNTVRLAAELSLLRMGLPLQLYVSYRNQEWVPGRNTRASNSFVAGARLLLKFW